MNGGYVESRRCLLDANRFVLFVVDSSSLPVSLLLKLNSLADYTCCRLKIGCGNDFPGAIRNLATDYLHFIRDSSTCTNHWSH